MEKKVINDAYVLSGAACVHLKIIIEDARATFHEKQIKLTFALNKIRISLLPIAAMMSKPLAAILFRLTFGGEQWQRIN